MPEMDGIELLKIVQNKNLDIPVVVMTAYKSLETAIETIRLGGYDYMVKPYEFEMVLITVNRAIEKVRLTKKAKVAERLKTIAAASVTLNHEINNPLTGIMGNLELLLDDLPEDNEEIKKGLKIALENSQRIADVVKKFQKISTFVTTEYIDNQLMLDLEKSSTTKADKNED
jgi:YesN/AraC family two-component response regulator